MARKKSASLDFQPCSPICRSTATRWRCSCFSVEPLCAAARCQLKALRLQGRSPEIRRPSTSLSGMSQWQCFASVLEFIARRYTTGVAAGLFAVARAACRHWDNPLLSALKCRASSTPLSSSSRSSHTRRVASRSAALATHCFNWVGGVEKVYFSSSSSALVPANASPPI